MSTDAPADASKQEGGAEPASDRAVEGRTLGDFVVREKIGAGGFGAVYRAEQTTLQREAVVKVLHARHQQRGPQVQRFLREAKLASRLDHPYAAHIYAFGAEPDGLLWIAMELVRGIPLDQLLAARGPVPLARFAPLFEHLCEVVHTAHELGIVHRDLKPANVMVLTRAGRLLPKLLDLGIAKGIGESDGPRLGAGGIDFSSSSEISVDDTPTGTEQTMRPTLTQEGALIGSPPYMAPEQWVSAEVGAPADIYALGAVAYEALTGKQLFSAKTIQGIARLHAKGVVPPLGADFPPALDAVLRKSLARDPAARYPDAVAFSRAVREAAGLGETSANLPRLPEAIRDQLLADAPQPIAEAVAALDAAPGVRQLLDAMWQTFNVVTRYLGLIAIAAASRTGLGEGALPTSVVELLKIMRRRGLSDEEWIDLARELSRPFAAKREAHPIPELIDLFFTADGAMRQNGRLEALLALHESSRAEQPERVAPGLDDLGGLLTEVGFLADYHLGVPRGQKIERWMGVRRQHRTGVASTGTSLVEQQPILMSAEGAPVLAMWPLFQVGAPSPGAPEELFLFDGQSRHGPRLIAPPHGFERRDPELWEHVRLPFGSGDEVVGAAAAERAPYRGLAGFSAEDAGLFFGRERESEAVANRLRVQALVAVIGPSGAGKSSFVHAGLLPLLPAGWRAITMRPGPSPIATLLSRLEREGAAPRVLGAALKADRSALHYELERIAGEGHVVLVIDQFEELFTLCDDAEARTLFCEAIVQSARDAESRVRVVLTMRDDFLLRAEAEPALRDRLTQGLQLLTTPAAADLLRILIEPAQAVGYEFEDRALAGEMVDAVVGQPGALPLLSFTASKLWDKRDRHFKQLRRRAYEALGKVGGALANHAEELLAGMSPDEQRMVREMFRHLVTAEGTRAVLSRVELVQILGATGHGEKVLERLIGARLLQAREGEGRVEQIEVVHEALLSAWPRLAEWRREDAEGARIRDQLRAAARQWDQRGRPRGMLWRTEALAELELWRKRHGQGLTAVDEAFAAASAADSARGRRLLRGALALAFALLAGGVLTLVRANGRVAASAAIAEDRLAELYEETGRKALLDGQPQQALVYLSEAYGRGRAGVAIRFLIERAFDAIAPFERAFDEHGERVVDADYHAGKDLVVTAAEDGLVRVWDGAHGKLLRALPRIDGALLSVKLLADGERVLSASKAGVVRISRPADGATLRELTTGSLISDVQLASAAPRVLVQHPDAAELWDLERGTMVHRFPGAAMEYHEARLSPDGQRLLRTTTDGNVTLWDAAGARLAGFAAATDAPSSGTFSADGQLALVPIADGQVAVVDTIHGKALSRWTAHHSGVLSATVTPDRKRVASTGADHVVRIWELNGKLLLELSGHAGPIYAARFSRDGGSVLSAGEDGAARVWDLSAGRAAVVLHEHAGQMEIVYFDGSTAITRSVGGGVKRWDVRRSSLIAAFSHDTAVVKDARFVGGDRVATLDAEGTIRLWDRARAAPLATERTAALDGIATISPDGARVAAARADGAASWPLGQRDQERALAGTPALAMRFLPDGHLFLAGAGGAAALWDVRTGKAIARLAGAQGSLFSAGASASGGLVAAGGEDQRVYAWRASGEPLPAMVGHRGIINAAEFSGDGRWLISASADNTARVWNVATGAPRATLDAENSLLPTAALSTDGSLAALGTNDGVVQVWDVVGARMLLRNGAHGGAVFAVSFDEKDAMLLTAGGTDSTARLWKVGVGRHTVAEVAHRVRCQVGLALRGGVIAPIPTAALADCAKP